MNESIIIIRLMKLRILTLWSALTGKYSMLPGRSTMK